MQALPTSPPRRRVGDRRHHRTERRRQDDPVQLHHRLLHAHLGPDAVTGAATSPVFRCTRARRWASVAPSRTSAWSRTRPSSTNLPPPSTSRSATTRWAGIAGGAVDLRGGAAGAPSAAMLSSTCSGCEELRDARVADLPYGVLKRVEIATVLATDPDLLLLDEPGSGMGPEEAHALGDTCWSCSRKFALTIVMIDHHVPAGDQGVGLRLLPQLRRGARRGSTRRRPGPPRGGRRLPGEDRTSPHPTRPGSTWRWLDERPARDPRPGRGLRPPPGPARRQLRGARRARCASCSGSTAPARPPRSAPSPGSCGRSRGRCCFDGSRSGAGPPSARVSAGGSRCARGAPGLPAPHRARRTSSSGPGADAARPGWSAASSTSCSTTSRAWPSATDQVAGTLSGGEQQMLAVGRALMSRPRLLLIDEASLGLSPTVARTVWEVTARIKADGTTVLMVEQNAGALPFADRALIMEKGTLVHTAVGEEIRDVNLRRGLPRGLGATMLEPLSSELRPAQPRPARRTTRRAARASPASWSCSSAGTAPRAATSCPPSSPT